MITRFLSSRTGAKELAMKDLRNKAVLITGVASGIGKSTAVEFARAGANPLILCDINEKGLEETAEIAGRTGCRVLTFTVDVSEYEQVRNMVDQSGRIDVLVNVAGIGMLAPIELMELSDWERVIGVNLWGVINTVHAVYPQMVKRRSGHIVNVSSSDGLFVGWIYGNAYFPSKFGVVGLSELLLNEGALNGIGVTCFCPGAVRTPIFENSVLKGFQRDILELLDKDLAHADTPEYIAEKIVEAVKRNKYLVLTTRQYQIDYFIRRHFQNLFFPYNKLKMRLLARVVSKYKI